MKRIQLYNSKSVNYLLLNLFIFTIIFFFVSGCNEAPKSSSKTDVVYSRVIESKKIRAAYLSYPPAVMIDSKTKKVSGIFVEVLEEAAKNLGLTVEWTEEVGWGAQIEGLMADRYDIVGSPVWANPTRGKLTTLSIPVYFSGIGIYVRPDDNRFNKDIELINSPSIKISTIDGETADLIARTQFPQAQRVSLPQMTDISQMFLDVKSNKADVLFAEPFFAYEFLKNNPNSIKNIAEEHPIKVLGNCYMFRPNEYQLKQMLDVAIVDLINAGFVDKLLAKYEPYPGTFYRVAYPYRAFKGAN